ncbi:MAG TPA: hypothetical protein VK675_00165 [Candidatus Paceibacterota bacterium]|nr:hypothetical protein [Candidatus Paceibacterota bacterium]
MKIITKNKIVQKFISSFLIISILTPSAFFFFKGSAAQAQGQVPVLDAEAVQILGTISPSTTTNTTTTVKGWVQKLLEMALMAVAKAVLAKITQATINWINSDFHGAPLFLTNPESFFKDIVKSQVRVMVDLIGYDKLRFPFGAQTALNIIGSFKRQLAENAAYSLSLVNADANFLFRFRSDFNLGGWNGFLINTQYPQNNYLGFNLLIQDNLAASLEGAIQAPAQKIQGLLQQGMGFLSPQTCPTNDKYNNGTNEFQKPSFAYSEPYPTPSDVENPSNDPSYNAAVAKWNQDKATAQAGWAVENTCPGGLRSTTPGSVAANQIMTAMSSSYRQSELAMALGNSLSAIFDALISHFLDKGLTALASTVSPEPSVDNWSYNGVTLDSNTTVGGEGTTTLTGLNVPTAASVRVDETISIPISGGTRGYTITGRRPDIATTEISSSSSSGYTLNVIGKTVGTFEATIIDSGTSCHKLSGTLNNGATITVAGACSARITITVNAIGVLAINPSGITPGAIPPIPTVSSVKDTTTTVNISGGDGNYSIQPGAGGNQNIAIAAVAGDSLIVAGVGPGRTLIAIKDTSTPVKTLQIAITVTATSAPSLVIPQNIKVDVGGSKTAGPITNGVGPYFVSVVNDTVAGVTVDPNSGVLSILGKAIGETQVDISDNSSPIKSGSTNVAVEAKGTCIYIPATSNNVNISVTVHDISETACLALPTSYPQYRSWTKNP